VPLGDLAAGYLERVRALPSLPAEEAAAFLQVASRLVLLKARSLLPAPEPLLQEEADGGEEELRARLLEYAAVRERAAALGERLRGGERAFHREGGTVEVAPRGGSPSALAAAWQRVLSLAARPAREEVEVPAERYSVEQRTAEIEGLVRERGATTFGSLLGEHPTFGLAVVTFIALLDLYRRGVVDLDQAELFGEITIRRRSPASP
jgi:segregation and condensation protein A